MSDGRRVLGSGFWMLGARASSPLTSITQHLAPTLRDAWWWVQEYFGEHDYDRYLADWHARHATLDAADETMHRPMTRRAFFEQRLQIKYGGTVQRCC